MAVTNQIRPQATAAAKSSNGEFKYLANGEEVRLSAGMVRKYLVSGDAANVTDQEVMMFLTLCKYQHLNPFLREAYLVKYGNTPATIVTGKDTFTKRANRNPKYKGKQAGIIVQDMQTGEVEYREGTFRLPSENIVGGWARIFIEGKEAEYNTVSFEEYAGRKRDGSLNSQWASKPATMIRKVAVVQALREAFPDEFGAMYSPEEMGDVNEVIPEEDTPVIIPNNDPQPAPQPQPAPEPAQEQPQTETNQSVADAFFS